VKKTESEEATKAEKEEKECRRRWRKRNACIEGPHIFTEQGLIDFKSGPIAEQTQHIGPSTGISGWTDDLELASCAIPSSGLGKYKLTLTDSCWRRIFFLVLFY